MTNEFGKCLETNKKKICQAFILAFLCFPKIGVIFQSAPTYSLRFVFTILACVMMLV